MAWLKHHGPLSAYIILALVCSIGFWQLEQAQTDRLQAQRDAIAETLYQNTVDGCERGNVIREVVTANTRQAEAEFPAGNYNEQLDLLLSVDNVNPRDGRVACEKIPRPIPDP